MKKLLKILGILLSAIVLIILAIIVYIKVALPDVGPAPDLTVDKSPARVERGRYLANSVMSCMDCHSQRNVSEYSMPMVTSTRGRGGERFDQTMGFPGIFYSANITPAGIGGWTDGEIYRAITTGVRKNGKPIFPVMPYHGYGFANPEDVKAVIAYIRSLPAIDNAVPSSSADFPMNIILNTVPKKAEPMDLPSPADSLANGKYLFTIASCHDCHTPFEKGKYDEKLAFAGGRVFPTPTGMVTSANITPDKETGIGSWTKNFFVQHFAMYRDSATAHRVIGPGELQTLMPWTLYGTMTNADLANIYTYIQTLQPIKHSVTKWKAGH
jgi:mono/diheme cytochrome c family protein